MSFQPVSLCQPRTFDFPCLSYNVNLRGLDGIPQELLDAVCENIYVEFMPPSSHPVVAANAPNHVFIKIDFTQPTEPTGEFIGVRIGMMPDISDPFARDSGFNSYASGHLRVLLVSYKRPSRRSFRAFTSRPLIPTLTLRLVLGALTESELQYFDFDTHSGVTHGWRDFV
ncbi:hypothetical protein F4776DRAFT_600126 [Hypoxylon sp. NC0597]|nr:hypothetical protein F4776DRAFT_600126 [Hypoxylon sp. NC0597]